MIGFPHHSYPSPMHEHTRPDRDEWVEVILDNIQTDKQDNFKRRDEAFSEGFDSTYDSELSLDTKSTPYDLESVLHYGFLDFSKNKKEVMKYRFKEQEDWPLQDPQDPLTIIDSVEIALVYSDEAGCAINSTEVVRYVHFNRMLNRIIIGRNERHIEQLKNDDNIFKEVMRVDMAEKEDKISQIKQENEKSKTVMTNKYLKIERDVAAMQVEIYNNKKDSKIVKDAVAAKQVEINNIKKDSDHVKDELAASQEEMNNLNRVLEKTKVDMASMQSSISRLSQQQAANEEKISQIPNGRGIELRGGSSWREGNLFVDGKPVCDDVWQIANYGNQNAGVVCRMLGFSQGTSMGEREGHTRFGAVPHTDWSMDDVQCTGTETDIRQCPATKNCGHCGCSAKEGAGVVCSN